MILTHINAKGIFQPISEYFCKSILQNMVVEMFALSNPENESLNRKVKGTPLGTAAFNATCRITEIDPIGSMIFAIPPLQCYGLIEESFLSLKKRVTELDTLNKGE